jgi:hypothetical protein
MVEQTPQAMRMAALVLEHAPTLKEAGFQKRRHGFNRLMDDQIVHLVNFWMAPKEPPAWTEIPGLRERLYGSFRIDFGVYIPAMNRSHTPKGPWINIYDCQMRRTMGDLMGSTTGDLWWSLEDPKASSNAAQALKNFGLPWLDQFNNTESVITSFGHEGPFPLGLSPAGGLDVADLCTARGENSRARTILENYVATPVLHTHAAYLTGYLEARGYDDLVPRITTYDPRPRPAIPGQ